MPLCEFVLNSFRSATTGYLPAYVVDGREPVLPLKHAFHTVVNCKVYSVAKRVHVMEQVIASARAAIARVADYMFGYTNHCRRDSAIDMGSFAWLSKEN